MTGTIDDIAPIIVLIPLIIGFMILLILLLTCEPEEEIIDEFS